MLAVEVDYETKRATIGTAAGSDVPREAILDSLSGLKFQGEFVADEAVRP